MTKFCNCKDCNKMKRKGKVLGAKAFGNYTVSAYVDHPKFAKGKRVRRPKQSNSIARLFAKY